MAQQKKKNRTDKSKQKAQDRKDKQGKTPEKMTSITLTNNDKVFKVRLSIKIAVIILSVLALSCFFEGLRQVQHSLTVTHALLFIVGTLFTAILLWLQAFWIYLEEKSKGTLKKTIVHFDKLEEYLKRRKNNE